jgi:hypothetical protein
MAKTYTAGGTVAAGDVATAAAWNVLTADINNLIVPPSSRILLTSNVSVANSDWTSFAGFTSSNASIDYDTDSMVSLSATASGMTVQTAGIYQVTATAVFAYNTTGWRAMQIARSRSGTITTLATSQMQATTTSNPPSVLNVSGQASFLATDLIRIRVVQVSGGALNLLALDTDAQYSQTQLSATWIGRTS